MGAPNPLVSGLADKVGKQDNLLEGLRFCETGEVQAAAYLGARA